MTRARRWARTVNDTEKERYLKAVQILDLIRCVHLPPTALDLNREGVQGKEHLRATLVSRLEERTEEVRADVVGDSHWVSDERDLGQEEGRKVLVLPTFPWNCEMCHLPS